MNEKFSQRLNYALAFSSEEAQRLGSDSMGIEHLMLGLIREKECTAIQILISLGVNIKELKKLIENSVKSTTKPNKKVLSNNIPIFKQAYRALKLSYLEAKAFRSDVIRTEHLLLAILRDEDNIVTSLLKQSGITYEIVHEHIKVKNIHLN